VALTPEQKAALHAEVKALINELKRRLGDRGISGVPNAEFISRWRGVRMEEPDGPPELTAEELVSNLAATRRRLNGEDSTYRGGVVYPMEVELSDATLARIDRQLDRIWGKEMTAARGVGDQSTQDGIVSASKPARVASDAALQKIDRETTVRNEQKNRRIQDEKREPGRK
jgi:hypothetical protein